MRTLFSANCLGYFTCFTSLTWAGQGSQCISVHQSGFESKFENNCAWMDYKEVDPEFQDDTSYIPIKGYDSEQKTPSFSNVEGCTGI